MSPIFQTCHQRTSPISQTCHQNISSPTLVTNISNLSPKYLVYNARHQYLKLVTNINLQIDDNIQNLKWDSDDCARFNIDESQIGNLVFDESNRPWRLWDTAHENKNLPKKIHDASKCYSCDNCRIQIYFLIHVL